jgi:hypothetical protein
VPVASNNYSETYLELVGNLRLSGRSFVEGNSVVSGNFFVNNQGKPVAAITDNGDLMIKGNIIFGDNPSNAMLLGASENNFYFQKIGDRGMMLNQSGMQQGNKAILNDWRMPKI